MLRDVNGLDAGYDSLRQIESVLVDVGQNDVAGSAVARHHGRHDPNRPSTRDDHVFTHHVEREGGVNCIAVGIKNTEQVRGDINIGSEYIGSRDGNLVGEGAISVYPHPQGIGAKV